MSFDEHNAHERREEAERELEATRALITETDRVFGALRTERLENHWGAKVALLFRGGTAA